MKIIYTMIFTVITTITLFFIGCNTNIIDETNVDGTTLTTLSGQIDTGVSGDPSYLDGCYVNTISGETELSGSHFDVKTPINECVQTFIVRDYGDNVYLMSRTPTKNNQNIEINTQTTTIALVTMHPLFSPVKEDEYQKVVDLITASTKYQALYNEVEKSIKAKRPLFDEGNEGLLLTFSNLMEDICGEVDDKIYPDSLEIIPKNRTFTKAIYENPKIYPLHAEISGNVLTLRNTGLTPSYYGTATHASGNTSDIAVPARSDYGGMDVFKTLSEVNLGPKIPFIFSLQGEYRFNLSRVNTTATLDFYMRVAGSVLSMLGLSFSNDDTAVIEISKSIANAITSAGSGVSDGSMDPMDWVGIAFGTTVDYLSRESSYLAQNGLLSSLRAYAKIIGGSLNWYNKIKGAANLAVRISYALTAPEELNFCLCCYDNKISTCTEASLVKISGDGQKGYAKQKLLLPLTVYVTTIGDDGNHTSSSTYHRVKFEVVSGGGEVSAELVSADNNNRASTYWTLGGSGEQKVKATVIDMITDKEISEPVYFTATLEKAQITIRLDWSKHSGNTDIDLHVVDPNGEEIAFYHMNSASGGYLDRDDVVGPGPEHVYWSYGPAGTYKIYVHYYPNEAEDRSVTSYKVSVTANGTTYRPATGSIAYDQFIPVGQFTVGTSPARSASTPSLDNTDNIARKAFPKK